LAISKIPLPAATVAKFGNAVRVMAYRRDSLPKNLNACFYVNSNVYGLTRIVQESDGSYLWQLEYLVDAGTAYSFTLHSDGTISGKGGFYGGVGLSKDLPNNKVSGTYKITGNLDECIGSFPDSNNNRFERSGAEADKEMGSDSPVPGDCGGELHACER
jgi:hypothetical protein